MRATAAIAGVTPPGRTPFRLLSPVARSPSLPRLEAPQRVTTRRDHLNGLLVAVGEGDYPIQRLLWSTFALLATSTSTAATPENTVAPAAVSYEVDQGWVSHYFQESVQNRWFKFTTVGGRSYCIEAAQGSDTHIALNPNLTYYLDSTGNSPALSNDNGPNEPAMTLGARVCFVDTNVLDSRTIRTAKLNVPIAASSGDSGYFRFRVSDTTLVAGHDWNLDASTPYAVRKEAQFHIHNLTGAAITVAYQTSGACASTTNSCGPHPSGTLVVAPRTSGLITPGQNDTMGWRFASIGIAAPRDNVRVYRVFVYPATNDSWREILR